MSSALVRGSAAAAARGATMGSAQLSFTQDNVVLGIDGSLTTSKVFDAGSRIVVYLTANKRSEASPAGNVSKHYAEVTVSAIGTYRFSIPIVHEFRTAWTAGPRSPVPGLAGAAR